MTKCDKNETLLNDNLTKEMNAILYSIQYVLLVLTVSAVGMK